MHGYKNAHSLKSSGSALILRGVPHFHSIDFKVLWMNGPWHILGWRGLQSSSPRSALSSRDVALPASALAPNHEGPHCCRGLPSWTPLQDRALSIRNSPISATISFFDAKIYISMNSCIKTPWVAELGYPQPPWMWPLDPAAPAPQNLWDAPSGRAELESRTGSFGVMLCSQCKAVCAAPASTVLACAGTCLH